MNAEFKKSVNSSPQEHTTPESPIDVRLLTAEDAANYIHLLRKNESRMADSKHKFYLLKSLGNEEGLIEHLESHEDRRGIWVDDTLIGGIDLTPTADDKTKEVSYWVDIDFTRRGVGRAALASVAAEADIRGDRLMAVVENDNFASQRVLRDTDFYEDTSKSTFASTTFRRPLGGKKKSPTQTQSPTVQ